MTDGAMDYERLEGKNSASASDLADGGPLGKDMR